MRLLLLLFFCLGSVAAGAQSNTQYVPLTKGMVVNYGEPSLNRLKYLKVAVQVRVQSPADAELVEYHRPALLDTLVYVFTASEEETMKSGDGKEAIRQLALAQLQDVMKAEEGDAVIEDLLFSTFVVQR
jgi:flagellar FliL protein